MVTGLSLDRQSVNASTSNEKANTKFRHMNRASFDEPFQLEAYELSRKIAEHNWEVS